MIFKWVMKLHFPYCKGVKFGNLVMGFLSKFNLKKKKRKSSHGGSAVMNPTSTHEDTGSIPGLAQWIKEGSGVVMSCV